VHFRASVGRGEAFHAQAPDLLCRPAGRVGLSPRSLTSTRPRLADTICRSGPGMEETKSRPEQAMLSNSDMTVARLWAYLPARNSYTQNLTTPTRGAGVASLQCGSRYAHHEHGLETSEGALRGCKKHRDRRARVSTDRLRANRSANWRSVARSVGWRRVRCSRPCHRKGPNHPCFGKQQGRPRCP
jgi:hypothetical protein